MGRNLFNRAAADVDTAEDIDDDEVDEGGNNSDDVASFVCSSVEHETGIGGVTTLILA